MMVSGKETSTQQTPSCLWNKTAHEKLQKLQKNQSPWLSKWKRQDAFAAKRKSDKIFFTKYRNRPKQPPLMKKQYIHE